LKRAEVAKWLSLALRKGLRVLSLFFMSPVLTLALALVILWFPLWVFRARGARLAGFDQRAWPTGWNVVVTVWDGIRAAMATGLLIRLGPELARVDILGRWQDAAFVAVAVAVGLIVQCLVWRDEDHVFAPVPYLLGVVAVAAHPIVLAIVLPLAVGTGLAVRAWAAAFIGGGMGMALVGLAVTQQDWRQGLLVGLTLCFPVLLSMVAGRHLGWLRRPFRAS
jgi:hypothetical protein